MCRRSKEKVFIKSNQIYFTAQIKQSLGLHNNILLGRSIIMHLAIATDITSATLLVCLTVCLKITQQVMDSLNIYEVERVGLGTKKNLLYFGVTCFVI